MPVAGECYQECGQPREEECRTDREREGIRATEGVKAGRAGREGWNAL